MSNISSKKLSESEKLPPVLAAWLPVILLALISIFLTYKALNDSKLMDMERIRMAFARWWPFQKARMA